MTDPTNRPLWQAMQDAYCGTDFTPEPLDAPLYAAEIRAIAEEIERRRRLLEPGYNLSPEEIIAWLLAEADRAEAGDP
jgi:hypothetical protein